MGLSSSPTVGGRPLVMNMVFLLIRNGLARITQSSCKMWLSIPINGMLYESVKYILRREHQVYTSEFSIQTANKGKRIFRLEIYPFLSDPHPEATFIISLYDVLYKEEPLHPEIINLRSTLPSSFELIPICASCKCIRNPKDEWITIEHFLKHQLSLQFTHDICPDCIRQLYPQYAGAFKRWPDVTEFHF